MPTYLLQWEVMRWARERGKRYYDMVAVPRPENLHEEDPLWGVYRFKVVFGGEIADFLVASIYPSNGYAPLRGTGSSRYTTGFTRS
jgi:lipid II:glycine glycyltransferase (peptidoglycan interpeptide bridge formation enzyme)